VRRARGQQFQARSQLLPQVNASATYQRQLQNQFQALQEQAGSPTPAPGPTLSSVCAPSIASNATPEQRAAALAQAQSCEQAGGGDIGSITRVFANPNNIILGLSGSQNIFTGGRLVAGTRAASAARRSAEIGLVSARAQLRLDVAQAYYDAALADRLVSIAESTFVQAERTFRQTSLSQGVGNTSEFELLRAQVARNNQRPAVIQARTQRSTAYLRLRQLLELPLDEPLALTSVLPEAEAPPALRAAQGPPAPGAPGAAVVPASTATSLQFNVDEVLAGDPAVASAVASVVAGADTAARERSPVRQARENVDAQRQQLRIARAQRLPAIQLQSNYQRFAYPEGSGIQFPSAWNQFFPNWTVSLGVSLPIFTGGRIRGDELIAQANLREAEEQAVQAEELAALDAQVAVAELEQAEEAFRVSGGTSAQAARAYQIAEVRYREGLSTQIELADSRLLLQQAQANGATAARDLQVARLRVALLRDLPVQLQNGGAAALSAQQRGGAAGQGGTNNSRGSQAQPQQSAAGAGGFTQTGTNTGGTNP
jgi:outer membrane protein TolC